MCVDHTMSCKCGSSSASLNFRDEIMPTGVVNNLYCPSCSCDVSHDPGSMLRDNGWIIEYDMDVVRFISSKLPSMELTPAFIFDEGYCTWRGVYPSDHIDSLREREELVALAKINKKKYLEEIKKWGVQRMERLSGEGWRKARGG